MPVDIGFDDDLPQGYVRSSYSIKPSAITVTGPKTVVEKMSKLILPTVFWGGNRVFSSHHPYSEFQKAWASWQYKEFQLRVNIIRDLSNIGDQIIVQLPVNANYFRPRVEGFVGSKRYPLNFPLLQK